MIRLLFAQLVCSAEVADQGKKGVKRSDGLYGAIDQRLGSFDPAGFVFSIYGVFSCFPVLVVWPYNFMSNRRNTRPCRETI